MPSLKVIANSAHAYLQENVVILLAGAITGAFIGGMMAASNGYQAGYAQASKDSLNIIKN